MKLRVLHYTLLNHPQHYPSHPIFVTKPNPKVLHEVALPQASLLLPNTSELSHVLPTIRLKLIYQEKGDKKN